MARPISATTTATAITGPDGAKRNFVRPATGFITTAALLRPRLAEEPYVPGSLWSLERWTQHEQQAIHRVSATARPGYAYALSVFLGCRANLFPCPDGQRQP